ncbi:MAG: sigma-70 family RNA polymerase sigma factor [Clostridia bacterium]|nr:sigma-70 family RNA polymerase sigma factor [Clostridia bacterium]
MTKGDENSKLLERYAQGDKKAEEELIKLNAPLVYSIAQRFAHRGQDIDDLVQIGTLGILKAVRGYKKEYGTVFSTYAFPLITGEIKRFLRDDGLIKVSREAKRNNGILMRAKEKFFSEHGREPRISELCEICGISVSDAVYAVNACIPSVSLQEKTGNGDGLSYEETCADGNISDITEKIALKEALEKLDEKEKKIVFLRYYRGLTQANTAEILGVNQVKISRSEKKIVEKLKKMLDNSA